MTNNFKSGDIVVFNNEYGFPNMQKELAVYYKNKYNISVGDKGNIIRCNTNGRHSVQFIDVIVSIRQHDIIKYEQYVEDNIHISDEVIIESNDDWSTPESYIHENEEELHSQIRILNEKLTTISNLSDARQVINNARVKELEEKNKSIIERMDMFEVALTIMEIRKDNHIELDNEWTVPEVD